MSTRRQYVTYSEKRQMGTNGKKACLQCRGDITAPRRTTFCTNKCAIDFRIKSDPSVARYQVFKRDRGVCSYCKVDTLAARKAHHHRSFGEWGLYQNSGHLWQADHIIPVVEGGGECGLDNLRTLCTNCHKRETAKLAARRAELRRYLKLPKLVDLLPKESQEGWL